MGDIQLLVLDLDGTIVGASNEILPETLEAIRAAQAQGIAVAIATGRMYQSALRFHRAIASPLPLITYQGAYIKDPATDQLHQHLAVSRVLAEALLDFFEEPAVRERVSVHFYIDDQLYVREITPETERYVGRSTVHPIAVGDLRSLLLHQEPTKVLAQSEDIELIDELWQSLKQRYFPADLYLTKSVATFLEATHPQVNKGAAVKYLAEEILGLQAENVMAIGDNLNDLEMLEYAGLGVAMGDAPVAVQKVAQWVAPDVEAGGAAAAIRRFLLR